MAAFFRFVDTTKSVINADHVISMFCDSKTAEEDVSIGAAVIQKGQPIYCIQLKMLNNGSLRMDYRDKE